MLSTSKPCQKQSQLVSVNMNITVLNQGIDSLYLRVGSISVASYFLTSRIADWRKYKDDHDYSKPVTRFVELRGLGTFKLLPCGHAPYEFVLVNDQIGDIRVWNPDKFLSRAALNTGQIYIDFRSSYLQQCDRTYSQVDQFISRCLELFFDYPVGEFAAVSRADLFCDTAGYDFGWHDVDKFVSRSRIRDVFNNDEINEALQALYLDPQMCNKGGAKATLENYQKYDNLLRSLLVEASNASNLFRSIFKKDLATLYLGRFGSYLYARIYDKSKEIAVSQKDYLRDIWSANGWDKHTKVWRSEFSISGDFLKTFWSGEDCSLSWHKFKSNLCQIWTYLTNDWCRHTNGDRDRLTRSTRSDWWLVVASSFDEDKSYIRYELPATASEQLAGQLLKQAYGCIKSVAGILIGGYRRAFGFDLSSEVLLREIAGEMLTEVTDQDIQDKRLYYGLDDYTDTQFSAALRRDRLKLGRGS